MRRERSVGTSELVERFAQQAIHDLDVGNMWTDLTNEIEKHISTILDTEKPTIPRQITERFKDFFRNEKGLEDIEEITAYVTAVAKEIARRKQESH